MYLMFLGPFSQGGNFRDNGITGMHRFIKRLWNLFLQHIDSKATITVESNKMRIIFFMSFSPFIKIKMGNYNDFIYELQLMCVPNE